MAANEHVDVAVVGGGIIGCAIAHELALRGRRTVVFERDRVGIGASSRNSGMIRITGRDVEELPLILESIPRWTELSLRPGVEIDYVRAGSLWLASNEREMHRLETIVARQEAAGLGRHLSQLLDRNAVQRLLPALSDFHAGGLLGTMDGHADPLRASEAFAALAEAAGAAIRSGVSVTSVERQGGPVNGLSTSEGTIRAETVVLAAGAWSPRLALTAGRTLPVVIRRGQAVRTRPLPSFTDLAVIAPQPTTGHIAIRQLRDGRATISGYQRPEYVGLNQEPTEETLRLNREAAERAFPCLVGAEVETRWAGLNEATLDALPLLGPDPRVPGLFLATGFSGHGFGIAPAVGRLMADLIVDGRTTLPVQPFSVDRFDHLDVAGELERFMSVESGGMYVSKEEVARLLGQS
ncbi:MAG: FAD-binding oxidoreductase [Chloroflexi bacterium]|nr:FAD-binding oxidoreductase [Chloroflexota bacterium]